MPGGEGTSSRPTPPCEGLHVFPVLRGLPLINHSFWDNVCLKSPKTSRWCLGLELPWAGCPSRLPPNVLQQRRVCTGSRGLINLTAVFLLCTGDRAQTSGGRPATSGGAVRVAWEALASPIVAPLK